MAVPQKPYDPLESYDPAAWARELDAPAAQPRSADQNTGLLSDYGTDIKRGLLQLPGAATGLADILVQGALGAPRAALEGASALTGDDTYHQWSQAANQPWVSKGAEALGEFTSVEPGKWADEARQEYSPERQAAKAEVEQAWEEGGAGNIASAYLSNPLHTIGGLVAESLPATAAGGFLGRGIAALAQAPRVLAAAPTLSKYLSPVAAGGKGFAFGAGEGAVAAGMHMEQATEQGAPADAAALTGLGVLGTTGVLGVLGGKIANKMGIGDVEQALAGGARGEAATTGLAGRLAEAAMQPTWAGRGTRVGFGAISEGLLEEAPQSALEQVWQNVATGQDLTTDLTRSTVEGALAGAGMGGGYNAFTSGRQPPAETPPATGTGVVPPAVPPAVPPVAPPPIEAPTPGAVPPTLAPEIDLTNPTPPTPTPTGVIQNGQKANAVPAQENRAQGQDAAQGEPVRPEGTNDDGQGRKGEEALLELTGDGDNILWGNTVIGSVDPASGALVGGAVLWNTKAVVKARKDPRLNVQKIEGAKGAVRVIGAYDAVQDRWIGQAPTTPEAKSNALPVPRGPEANSAAPGESPAAQAAAEAAAERPPVTSLVREVPPGTAPTAEELTANALQDTPAETPDADVRPPVGPGVGQDQGRDVPVAESSPGIQPSGQEVEIPKLTTSNANEVFGLHAQRLLRAPTGMKGGDSIAKRLLVKIHPDHHQEAEAWLADQWASRKINESGLDAGKLASELSAKGWYTKGKSPFTDQTISNWFTRLDEALAAAVAENPNIENARTLSDKDTTSALPSADAMARAMGQPAGFVAEEGEPEATVDENEQVVLGRDDVLDASAPESGEADDYANTANTGDGTKGGAMGRTPGNYPRATAPRVKKWKEVAEMIGARDAPELGYIGRALPDAVYWVQSLIEGGKKNMPPAADLKHFYEKALRPLSRWREMGGTLKNLALAVQELETLAKHHQALHEAWLNAASNPDTAPEVLSVVFNDANGALYAGDETEAAQATQPAQAAFDEMRVVFPTLVEWSRLPKTVQTEFARLSTEREKYSAYPNAQDRITKQIQQLLNPHRQTESEVAAVGAEMTKDLGDTDTAFENYTAPAAATPFTGAVKRKGRAFVRPEGAPSEGTPSLRSTTLGAAQAVVDRLVGNNPAAKRRIVLVQDALDPRVPAQAFEAAWQASEAGKQVRGWIQTVNGQQTIYLFYGSIRLSEMASVLMHELTHASDKTMRRFAGRIKKFAAADVDSSERRIARAALQRVAAADVARENVDSEIIAYFVEEAVRAGIDPMTGAGATPQTRSLLREVWQWIRGMLNKLGFYNFGHFTAEDIVSLVHSLAQTTTFGLEQHGAARAVVADAAGNQLFSVGPAQEAAEQKEKIAGVTPQRIDRLLREFGYDFDPKRSKAWIAWVDPKAFVRGTTANGSMEKAIYRQSPYINLRMLSAETQTPFLQIKDGEIWGHEGRHRMAALAESGIERVAVVLIDWDYTPNKQPHAELFLRGQSFRDEPGGKSLIVENAVPLAYGFEGRIGADFSSDTAQILFSVEAPTLATDLNAQSEFLTQRAAQAGYADLNDMLFKDPDAFFDLAAEWRDGHPREGAGGQQFGRDARSVETPTTQAALEKIVRDLTGRDTNWRIYVGTFEELKAKRGGLPSDTFGFVETRDGKKHAYFITDRIEAGTELSKFMHEVGAHIGLENVLTKEQQDDLFFQVMQWTAAYDGGDRSLEARIARRAADRVERAGTPEAERKFEAIAYFLEEAVQAGVNPTALKSDTALNRWFRTLWAAFKVALRKLNIVNLESLTAQHVVDLAYGAARLELAGYWHGSAGAFRRFNSEFMSSGAGDQWYSWGHYIAKRQGIGEHYRKMVEDKARDKEDPYLTLDNVPVWDALDVNSRFVARQTPKDAGLTAVVDELSRYDYDVAAAITAAFGQMQQTIDDIISGKQYYRPADQQAHDLHSARVGLQWLKSNSKRLNVTFPKVPESQLHRVDVDVRPEETMHWDKPLSEQPQKVQDALRAVTRASGDAIATPFGLVAIRDDMPGSELHARMVEAEDGGMRAANWQFFAHTSSKAASMFLDSIGIKGMEHWDESSRSAGAPVPNLFLDDAPLGVRYSDITSAGGYDLAEADGLRSVMLAHRELRQLPGATDQWLSQAVVQNAENRVPIAARDWLRANKHRISVKTPPDTRSTNLVVFNDKNIHTVGRAPGGDLSRVQYGKNSPSAQLAANWWEASKEWTREQTRGFWQRHGFALYTDPQLNERHGTEGSRKVATIKDAITFDATQGIQEAAQLDNRWVQLPKAQADLVSHVLHEGRRLGINPANIEKYQDQAQWNLLPPEKQKALLKQWKLSTPADRAKLLAQWKALTDDAKAIHQAALDYYRNSLLAKKAILETVRDQVRKTNVNAKSDEIDMVLKTFENAIESAEGAAEEGTYTPFIRVGDFHVIGMSPEMAALEAHREASQKDPVNNVWTPENSKRRDQMRQDPNHYVVQGATSVADMQKKHRALALKFGKFGVQSMQNKVHSSMLSTADLTAISKYRATLENSEMDAAAVDAAVFALQKLMIELLPEGHQLKRTLRAELVAGEEPDARAVFAQVARSDAHYMARLKHANELSEAMAEMQRVGNTIPPANAPGLTDAEREKILRDAEDARAVSNEFVRRANQTMSELSPTANWLLNWSFFDHLGGSAAFLLMNAHQPWTVTLPVLAARLGGASKTADLKKVGEALWRHSKAAAKMLTFTKTGTAGQLATAQAEARVSIDTAALLAEAAKIQDLAERAKREQQIHFLEHLTRTQLLDITLEHNLGTSADTRLQTLGRAIRTISMPVQAGEMINRAASGLAAFELGLEKFNGDVGQATAFAEKIVRDTQIDYSAGHTARAMRSVLGSQPLARVMFQFWKYRQGMLFLTFSSLKDGWLDKSVPEAERQAARRAFAGLYATTMLTAGIFEGPLIAGGLGALSMLAGLGGDDDDPPVDLQRNIRNWMADIDPLLGEVASKGLWSLAGIDMSKRLGMGDLANPLSFARFTGQSGRDDAATVLAAAAGAPFATVADTWDGVTKIARGDVRDGIQQIVPLKGAADLMRAWGLGTEGLQTKTGEQIKGPESFSARDVIARAGGAQPLAMSRYYEGNAAVQAAKKAATEGRKALIAEYAQARRRGEPSADAMRAIKEYNARHPEKGLRITTETLLKAVQERAKIEKQRGDTGVLRSPQNKPFLEYGRFAEAD